MRITIIIGALLLAAIIGLSDLMANGAMYGLIHADAQGYYGYLVAIFLEQSFNWEQVIHSYSDVYLGDSAADFTVNSDWGRVNKYYVGTAVLMLPFFLLSCVAAWLFGFPVDGYSAPFHIGIMFGALIYVGIGMYVLSKYLENKGTSRALSLFVVISLLFGTGLFHYSISEPAMSHVYSFALFCGFIFLVDKWFKTGNRSVFILSAVVFGFIVLVRPTNGLVLFSVPFIAGGLGPLKNRLLATDGALKMLVLGVAVVVGILSLQSMMYLAQVGKPVIWSYKNEGFNFLSPEIRSVLFSYQKGFFVYTPLAALATIGLVWMMIKRKAGAGWLVGFLALVVYVISSWWNWYYGASLGMRPLIEYLAFFGVGLAFLLQNTHKLVRVGLLTFCLFLTSINIVQSYQYQKFILHWNGMNQERFWTVFMKTSRKYEGIFYRQPVVLRFPTAQETLSWVTFESDMESGTNWGTQGFTTAKSNSGNTSSLINERNRYGTTLTVPVLTMGELLGEKKLFITAMVWSSIPFPDFSIGYSYKNHSSDYGHGNIPIGQLVPESEQWVKVQYIAPLNTVLDSTLQWVVYPFTPGDADIYLDDIRYEVITLNPASEQP